ncbi:hypothetical protein [Thermoclostridium caenicola]|uniref:DUF948 domain-containing protein n=1 Tax=Thermoclostridium caenicola TaxID=659425 RepID=A0A1M6CYD1_9FIRM|nr:hypothetical protein [Thermoclostridium caenicola]SHI65883.1 hypothetical protein SAMN05444373_100627 [Thermoclostridium caenicola]
MFDKPISWGELITIVLFVLGAALIFYLILAAANLVRLLKNVNRLFDSNKENINQTLEKLPRIASDAEKIADTLKNNVEAIDQAVKDVGKITSSVKKGVETIQNDILVKAKIFMDIIDAVRKYFDKKKKASASRKKEAAVYRYKYKKDQDKPDEVEIIAYEKPDKPCDGYIEDSDNTETELESAKQEDVGEDESEAD